MQLHLLEMSANSIPFTTDWQHPLQPLHCSWL